MIRLIPVLVALVATTAHAIPFEGSVPLTWGDLETSFEVSGELDPQTGIATVDAFVPIRETAEADGIVLDVESFETVLVSGTPGNPFDPPVYAQQLAHSGPAVWSQSWVIEPGFICQACGDPYPLEGVELAVRADRTLPVLVPLDFGTRTVIGYDGATRVLESYTSQGGFIGARLTFGPGGSLEAVEALLRASNTSGEPTAWFHDFFPLGGEPIGIGRAEPFVLEMGVGQVIPEPGVALLMGLGLAGLAWGGRDAPAAEDS